ncbi:putative gfo/Idh/MocA-like oxidoreductase, NAD(P)-binding domain superfamily [Helianthus annuus]|nr:putative gfo/Idh/MocA-like oxidoreductase, NAD(P)-binding domain superfamily [Helianthus annuus]
MQSLDLNAIGMGLGVNYKNLEQKVGEKMVKYGIIGAGMMGREHLLNLYHLRSEGAAVVCVADPHLPSQKISMEFAESFGWPLKVKKTLYYIHAIRVVSSNEVMQRGILGLFMRRAS